MRRFSMVLAGLAAVSSFQAETLAAETAPATGTFCQRIAAPLKLEISTDRYGATVKEPVYIHTQYSFQAFMVGDSFPTSVQVEPADDTAVSDYKRLQGMCAMVKKGIRCDLAGPAIFKTQTRYAGAKEPLAAGENAVFRLEGSTIICQDRPSTPVQN